MIGVVSDTHDFLDPRVPDHLKGVEHILHGGDIGSPAIILELGLIAPVTAVAGNTDDPGLHYRHTEVVSLSSRKVLLHHIVNPLHPTDELRDRIARERPDVVVFGHTHKPFCETIGGVLFLNPGYAGKPRFGMQRSLALLDLRHKTPRVTFRPL